MFKDCTTTGQEDFPNTSFIILLTDLKNLPYHRE